MTEELLIPVTPMTRLYWEVHFSQKQRLAKADEYVKRPETLAAKFIESRNQFGREFDWSEFPFHKRKDPRAFKAGASPVKRTRDLACALLRKTPDGQPLDENGPIAWKVQNAPLLSFSYVDREIQPARTDVETSFAKVKDAPAKAPKKLSFDLLLANASDRTPIVCEVKLTTERDDRGKLRLSTDKDPFFALIQVLTSTAHLATRSQLRRLESYGAFDLGEGRFDVYVMIRGQPAEKAKYWFKLRDRAREVADELLGIPEIRSVIRRIEFLEIEAKQGFETRSADDLNPWFGYPVLTDSPKFTLNFNRFE